MFWFRSYSDLYTLLKILWELKKCPYKFPFSTKSFFRKFGSFRKFQTYFDLVMRKIGAKIYFRFKIKKIIQDWMLKPTGYRLSQVTFLNQVRKKGNLKMKSYQMKKNIYWNIFLHTFQKIMHILGQFFFATFRGEGRSACRCLG